MSANKTTIIEAILGMDYQDLHDYATKRVGSQDADDIVQEAYLHFLQRDVKDVIREPRAFLFKIAGNLSIDSWRKAKHRSECGAVDSELDLDELPCPMPGP
jgi:RNA polymerase sigma-70 factor (ECF subfamily)